MTHAAAVTPTVAALAAAIPLRRTNRWPFAGTVVPADILDELRDAARWESALLAEAGPDARDAILGKVTRRCVRCSACRSAPATRRSAPCIRRRRPAASSSPPTTKQLVQALAAAAAAAITNATLLHESRRRNTWQTAMVDVSTQLLAGTDSDEVLRQLVQHACRTLAGLGATVRVPTDDPLVLRVGASTVSAPVA